jgi:membrane protein
MPEQPSREAADERRIASYNETYGTMAGVIVCLIWLWISNLAILPLLGFDAQTVRQRATTGGYPPEAEPYSQPRGTRKGDEEDRRRLDETCPRHSGRVGVGMAGDLWDTRRL